MKDNCLISKKMSSFIKGIAIILMLLHHLFAYSDRYPENIEVISIFNNIYIEQMLGQFGKYCVPLFLFISGYGFSISTNINTPTKYYIDKVYKFFISYWLVFIIFIPLSYLYSSWSFVKLDLYNFILNFFALSSSYNGEWWFIKIYLLLMLLTPFIHFVRKYPLAILALSFVMWGIGSFQSKSQDFLYWQPAYIIGFVFAEEKINWFINNLLFRYTKLLFLISLLTLYITFFSYGWDSMPFMVFFLIIFIGAIYLYTPMIIRNIISDIGDKSLFLWMTHSFYCYHFAKNFVYYPNYTLFIFLNLLAVSYITSFILMKINDLILFYLKNKGILNV